MTPEQREQRYQAFLHELDRSWTNMSAAEMQAFREVMRDIWNMFLDEEEAVAEEAYQEALAYETAHLRGRPTTAFAYWKNHMARQGKTYGMQTGSRAWRAARNVGLCFILTVNVIKPSF